MPPCGKLSQYLHTYRDIIMRRFFHQTPSMAFNSRLIIRLLSMVTLLLLIFTMIQSSYIARRQRSQ